MLKRRDTVLLIISLILLFFLMSCVRANVKGSKGKGTYELQRSLIKPNYWEVHIKGDVRPIYDASLKGINDLGLKIWKQKVDDLSGVIDGAFADSTEFRVNLTYESPGITLMQVKGGMTGNKTLSIQIFKSIEKYL